MTYLEGHNKGWNDGYKAGQRDEHQQHSWDGSELDRLAHEESLKRQGRREVVEWMNNNCLDCQSNTPCNTDKYLGFHLGSWQVKLKEWGIG